MLVNIPYMEHMGLLKLNYSDKLDQKKLLYIRLYSDDYESETVILSDH